MKKTIKKEQTQDQELNPYLVVKIGQDKKKVVQLDYLIGILKDILISQPRTFIEKGNPSLIIPSRLDDLATELIKINEEEVKEE